MSTIYRLVLCFLTTLSYVSACSLDLVYVIDASESVGDDNFASLKTYLATETATFDVNPSKTHLSIVQYSRVIDVVGNLNQIQTNDNAVKTINNLIYYHPSATATGDALETVRTSVLTEANGNRASIPDVVVVFTDGITDVGENPAVPAQKLRDAGVKIIAVGLGNAPDDELRQIAGDNVRMYSSYSDLDAALTDYIKGVGCTA